LETGFASVRAFAEKKHPPGGRKNNAAEFASFNESAMIYSGLEWSRFREVDPLEKHQWRFRRDRSMQAGATRRDDPAHFRMRGLLTG